MRWAARGFTCAHNTLHTLFYGHFCFLMDKIVFFSLNWIKNEYFICGFWVAVNEWTRFVCHFVLYFHSNKSGKSTLLNFAERGDLLGYGLIFILAINFVVEWTIWKLASPWPLIYWIHSFLVTLRILIHSCIQIMKNISTRIRKLDPWHCSWILMLHHPHRLTN